MMENSNIISQVSPVGSDESDVGQLLPSVPQGSGPQTISLAVLMDFAIQQTLHELTILSEMLPMKDYSERQKSIVQFAHATRLMFVKLLAIVKWLRTSKKFEPLASIDYFLDTQANQFIQTADSLCQLARVELQNARLPLFQISTAIDVLTTGTFPRLPMVIKDAFVPEEKLSTYETRKAILLLNERLVFYLTKALPTLPKRVTIFRVHNGTIVMRVKGEFQIRMTILPRKKEEFMLLSVAILVRDYEIGGGMELVHPLQLNALHEAIQVRINISSKPFLETYNIMHSFALALQLDVLECQTRKLAAEIAPNYIKVEKYNPYEGYLIVRYWVNEKATSNMSRIQKLLANSVQYKMRIYCNKDDQESGLLIRHEPPAAVKMIDKVPNDREISMGRLLSEVIEIRIRERLLMVRQLLNQVPPGVKVHLAGDAAPILIYELLVHETKSHLDEQLIVSINAFFGHVVCQVHCIGQHEELRNLEKELNGSCQISEITRIIKRLRVLLMINRYMRAISSLTMVQIIADGQMSIIDKLKNIPKDRILMQLVREPSHYLVVGFIPTGRDGLEVIFRVITQNKDGKLASIELNPMYALAQTNVPKMYQSINEIQTDELEMEIDNELLESNDYMRSANERIDNERPDKAQKRWNGEEGQVRQIIAAIEDRIAFWRIAEELDKRGIAHDTVKIDNIICGPYLKITDLKSIGSQDCENFFDSICSIIVRMDSRRNFTWPFEYVFKNPPLISNFYQNRIMGNLKVVPDNTLIAKMVEYENERLAVSNRYKTIVQDVQTNINISMGESVAANLTDKVAIFSHLYGPVKRFSLAYNYFESAVDVLQYTYHKLILAYGPQRNYSVNIYWRPQSGNNGQFGIFFGQYYYQSMLKNKYQSYEKKINPHLMVQNYLIEKFNGDRDLIDLTNYLVNTTISMQCLTNLVRLRIRSYKSYQTFIQSDNTSSFPLDYQIFIHAIKEDIIRIVCGSIHLEFLLLTENAVTIRDVTPDKPAAIGLIPFIKKFKPIANDYKFTQYPNLPKTDSLSNVELNQEKNDTYQPASVPSSNGVHNNVINPRSVPENYVTGRISEEDDTDINPFEVSRRPYYIQSRLLMRICTDMDAKGIPIDNYFFALSFLQRIGKALESHKDASNIFGVPINALVIEPDNFTITTSTVASSKEQQGMVSLTCYLCPEDYRIKAKLSYKMVEGPKDIEKRIVLRYFNECVAPLMNEFAVLSFLNLCRISNNDLFGAITTIMDTQMTPRNEYFWRISLQLAPINPPADHLLGVIFKPNDSTMILTICLRPNKNSGKERFTERRCYDIIYNFETKHVSIKQAFKNEEDSVLQPIIQSQSEKPDIWPLWSCIRILLERSSLTE